MGALVGPYRVLPLEGRGGMADVYRAHDTRLDRPVALKVLRDHRACDPQAAARLKREALALASLSHINIASIYGVEDSGDVHALVLELVDGPTLADRLARGPLPVDEALRIGTQIASALQAAHARGIVHRDLKPSNIKLRPDGTVKVLDFGLVKIVDPAAQTDDGQAATITMPVDAVVGTAAYMSPEQLRSQPVDGRTDIWALGCVMFEMLSGRPTFAGDTIAQTIASVLSQEPEWDRLPENLSPSRRALLKTCLRKDPAERLRDAGDVRLALEGRFEDFANPPRASWLRRSMLGLATRWSAAALLTGATVVGVATMRPIGAGTALSFELHAPRGTTFNPAMMEPYPALSPDGRRLAFVTTRIDRPSLWVQTIGELEAHAVPGSEAATAPFWSPDGRFVAFQAGNQLKKASVIGDRPVQTLHPESVRSSGAWTGNGTIIFSTDAGLHRIPAEGGASVPVTRVDPARGEFSHRWPSLVPGNDSLFIYLVRSSQDDTRGVYLGSLDDPSLKQRILPDDSNATFDVGPDERLRLFYVRDSTLLAQLFDLDGRRVTGEPIVVARPVLPGQSGRLAPYSISNGTLVYRPATSSPNRLVWMNRQGERLGFVGDESVEHRQPALSPDGTHVATAQVDPTTGRIDVWVYDLVHRTSERLTRDRVGAFMPLWRPDGRNVIYASAEDGPWNLYGLSISGSGSRELVYGSLAESIKYPTDITSDGAWIVFQGIPSLYRLPLRGPREPAPIVRGLQGRVSPDGRWLAYTSIDAGERQVYVTTFPEATERWRISTARGEDPQWRRDGRELYFIEGERTLTAVPLRAGQQFATGPPRLLFQVSLPRRSATVGSHYAPSPDGQRFLVVEAAREEEILLRVTTNWTPGP